MSARQAVKQANGQSNQSSKQETKHNPQRTFKQTIERSINQTIDWAILGTYFFLFGCLMFSLHSLLVIIDHFDLMNLVYLIGTTLFTLGSICHVMAIE